MVAAACWAGLALWLGAQVLGPGLGLGLKLELGI